MVVRELAEAEIEALVGSRHGVTGLEYPANGLQPYYAWLVRALHLLAESSAGALRVARDAGSVTAVRVMPGRATVDDVVVAYEGGELELASLNNDTALVWLVEDGGEAKVEAGASGDGWPGEAHIKLAEVELAEGVIVGVVDRRFETMLKA